MSKASDRVWWGIGIEQEAMPLYQHYYMHPIADNDERIYPVRDAVNIDAKVRRRLAPLMKKGKYLMDIMLDYAGNERMVLELVTRDFRSRQLFEYVQDLIETRKVFMNDFNFMVMPYDHHKTRAVWPLTGADYLVYKKDKSSVDVPRYLGSYHINITLPHPQAVSDKEFKQMHIEAAMALQWIEPLLMASYGCPSPASVLDGHMVTEMSVRHSEEPLAMALAKDLMKGFASDRKAVESSIGPNKQHKRLRRGMRPIDRDVFVVSDPDRYDPTSEADRKRALTLLGKEIKLQADQYPMWLKSIFRSAASSPMALRHFIRTRYGSVQYGLPLIGTDFRRDPEKGGRFGFEFRMMDYFPADYLVDVLRLFFYVMDASAEWTGGKECDAFLDPVVHEQYVSVILEGWNTHVLPAFRKAISKAFQINLSSAATDCFALLKEVSNALYAKFGRGKGYYSRFVDKDDHGIYHDKPPEILNINKASWEVFFQNGYPDLAAFVRRKTTPVTAREIAQFLKVKFQKNQQGVAVTEAQILEDLEEIQAYQKSYIKK